MKIPTIEWTGNSIKMIDQTKLPFKLEFIYCKDIKSLWYAIRDMNIRGAPVLGIAAGFGVVLTAMNSKAKNYCKLKKELKNSIDYLKTSRPTAVNLSWALDRMWNKFKCFQGNDMSEICNQLYKEAIKIMQEDIDICTAMAKNGATLINDNDNILTHCNAGALATGGYGTALGVFYYAKQHGKSIHIYVDETRPRLQGARLTTWELKKNKVPFTLICDNMAAILMSQGKIDKVMVGADRIASNGDTANKIGTYSLAVLANFHNIPFYVVAPSSTFDLKIDNGEGIPVEERDKKEIIFIEDKPIAPLGTKTYNPAFDVTPAGLIKSIIAEKRIIKPPFKDNILKTLNEV